jgi:hypothetical protein
MCDKELLVSFLYDELDAPEQKALQQHLAACRECRDEAGRLRALRTQLGAWTVPDVPLDLRIPLTASGRSRVGRWRGWGLAAAAVLLLAVASALAGVEIQAVGGGVTIRTAWSAPPQTAVPTDAVRRDELAPLQAQIRDLQSALAAEQQRRAVVAASTPATPATDDAEVLRRVREMIRQSEDRQQQVLAARLVQGIRELQAAHSTDLIRLERALSQQQSIWNDEQLRHREEMRQVYRLVSQQQMQR